METMRGVTVHLFTKSGQLLLDISIQSTKQSGDVCGRNPQITPLNDHRGQPYQMIKWNATGNHCQSRACSCRPLTRPLFEPLLAAATERSGNADARIGNAKWIVGGVEEDDEGGDEEVVVN